MIEKYKNIFDIEKYKRDVGYSSNIHNVSFFHKNIDLKDKKILILDFEFSKNNYIYEFGGIIIENKKITKLIFEEFSIPKNEQVWGFKENRYIYNNYLNKNKPLFKKENIEKLFNEVDYIVVHNYVAEAQCLYKLFNGFDTKYDFQKCKFKDKIICTNYSFNNQYFKNLKDELKMESFSNEKVFKHFNWNIEIDKDTFLLQQNNNIILKIKSPNEKVNANVHNAFYDCIITLANLISLSQIKNK